MSVEVELIRPDAIGLYRGDGRLEAVARNKTT